MRIKMTLAGKLILWSAVLVLLASMLACGQGAAPAPAPAPSPAPAPKPAPAAKPIILRLSTYSPATHIASKLVRRYAEEVEKRSGGRLVIKVFVGESLVRAREELRALSEGVTDIGLIIASYVAGEIQEYGAESLPFTGIARTPEIYNEYQHSIEPLIQKAFAKHNIRWLGSGYTGNRQIFTSKPINTLADLKGLKLRVSGRWQEMTGKPEIWDFGAVAMPSSEQYVAMQRGTVDGTVTTVAAYISYKLYDVVPYATIMNQNFGSQRLSINLDVWKTIPPDLQKIMTDVGWDMTQWSYDVMVEDETARFEDAKKVGATVYVLPDDEKARWITKAMPIWDQYVSEVPEGKPWVDLFKELQSR